MLNIAHRGARAFAPENTIPAFEKAKKLGANMIEIDVRLTKDLIPVIHHDETLDRCTDINKYFTKFATTQLNQFNLDQIQRFNTGYNYVNNLLSRTQPFKVSPFDVLTIDETQEYVSIRDLNYYLHNKTPIPTLEETLIWAKENSMKLLIELKTEQNTLDKLINETINLIYKTKMQRHVIIQSFDHFAIKCTHAYAPHIKTAILVDSKRNQKIKDEVKYLHNIGADGYSFNYTFLQHIDKILDAGFFLFAWTVNDTEAMKRLISLGVTGIISDFPNRVVEI